MDLGKLLMEQTTVMFMIMGIGYFIRYVKLIPKGGGKELSIVLINIALPFVIFEAIYSSGNSGLKILNQSFVWGTIALVISMAVAFLCFGKRKPIQNFGVSFSNAGFMGLPLVEATMGAEGVIYVTGVVVLLNILQWTYGLITLTQSFESIKLKKLLANPVIMLSITAYLLIIFDISLPKTVVSTLNLCKGINTPLAMIIIGISLADTNIVECFTKVENYIAALVRLIIIPLVTIGVFKCLPYSNKDMIVAILIVACAPIGSNVAVAAQMYNKDFAKAVQIVCLSTLLSIVTIPIMIEIALKII